ncbi:hypothetical protein WMW72_24895 [Paenibacillus filicis]|uniref:YfhD-like protein n=1 Tax=Paenibacillus filicis TaxID=669464 RepID=A0ABU9DQM3_9BACL
MAKQNREEGSSKEQLKQAEEQPNKQPAAFDKKLNGPNRPSV